MAGPSIDQIRARELDASGNKIQRIFAKNAPEYAVHHDPARVLARFADDPDREEITRVRTGERR